MAENIAKVEEILEHIHSEHMMGDGEGDKETAPEVRSRQLSRPLSRQHESQISSESHFEARAAPQKSQPDLASEAEQIPPCWPTQPQSTGSRRLIHRNRTDPNHGGRASPGRFDPVD